MPDSSLFDLLHKKLGERIDDFLIPPPVFETMQGEFLAYDQQANVLRTRFPVLQEFLNPYRSVQGGILAAAVDNTIGPLSMLVAPPNVTRRLEMKYSNPVTPQLQHITVEGRFLGREGQWLTFSADVRDEKGNLLARAKARHWIIDT